jgi:hypothetical protein
LILLITASWVWITDISLSHPAEKRFITWFGTCHGKRQSKHSAHL